MKHIIFTLAILSVVSCGTQRKTTANNASSDNMTNTMENVSASVPASATAEENGKLAFGLSLFNAAVATSGDAANVVVSPYSAGMALSMLSEGAAGQTKSEIESVLKGSSYKSDVLKSTADYTISSANSIWLRSGFSVKPDFRAVIEGPYAAKVSERDFSSPATVKEINKWCSDNTAKKIPEIIDQINPDMVMFILNALYFKAPWEYQFDKRTTSKAVFHSPSGEQTVDFMHLKKELCCGTAENCRFVVLPYKSGEWQMAVCLPDEGADIKALVSSLSASEFAKAISGAEYRQVALSMPKFKVNTTMILNNILRSLGMKTTFSDAADFSSMAGNVAVDEVKQKCFIEVNEEGAEAAAVTSIGMRLTSVAPEPRPFVMNVERPFVFAIFNAETNSFLFAGKIASIEEK